MRLVAPTSLLALALALTACRAALPAMPDRSKPAAGPLQAAGSAGATAPVAPAAAALKRPALEPDAVDAPSDQIVVRFKPGAPLRWPGATLVKRLGADTALFRLPASYTLAAAGALSASYAQAASGYALAAAESFDEDAWDAAEDAALSVEPAVRYRASGLPNDPYAGAAWGLAATGATDAWAETRGQGARVAVLDTGIAASHPDLQGQLEPGLDAVDGTNPADGHGHGTHVSGTIVAIANNRIGIAGLAPAAKVLPVKVLGADGVGSNATIAHGLELAVARGAKIINLSLGGGDSTTLARAVRQAQAAGALVIAAAGNEGVDAGSSFPAAYDGVLAVGAVDQAGARPAFSNFGPLVDLAAPGVGIASCGLTGNVVSMSGTSMATPHVSAAAALVWARYPDLRANQVAAALVAGGPKATGFAGSPDLRRLSLEAALEAASHVDTVPPPAVSRAGASPGAPGEIVLTWDAPASDAVRYRISRGTGADAEVLAETNGLTFTDAGLEPGERASYGVSALDAAGNASAPLTVSGTAGVPDRVFTSFRLVKREPKALTFEWETAEPVISKLQWGPASGALTGATPLETAPARTHRATISGLSRFKRYAARPVTQEASARYGAVLKARTKLFFLFAASSNVTPAP